MYKGLLTTAICRAGSVPLMPAETFLAPSPSAKLERHKTLLSCYVFFRFVAAVYMLLKVGTCGMPRQSRMHVTESSGTLGTIMHICFQRGCRLWVD